MNPAHARGTTGEMHILHILSSRGYYFVEGLSSGQSVTRGGLDGVAYNPHSDRMIIYDNKAYRHKNQFTNKQLVNDLRTLISIIKLEVTRSGVSSSTRSADLNSCLAILDKFSKSVDNNQAKPINISLENRSIRNLLAGKLHRLYTFNSQKYLSFELGYFYQEKKLKLAIIDNHTNNVGNAAAIDIRFKKNAEKVIGDVTNNSAIPRLEKQRILELLQKAHDNFPPSQHQQWPNNVRIIVFNASGYSTGISPSLLNKGIQFVDVYDNHQIMIL